MKQALLKFCFIITAVLSLSLTAFATAPATDLNNYRFNTDSIRVSDDEKSGENVSVVIVNIISFAVKMAGTVAIIVLVIGGLTMVISQGNSEQIDKGKDIVKYAIIGLIIIFLSLLIVTFVQNVLINDEINVTPGIQSDDLTDPSVNTS